MSHLTAAEWHGYVGEPREVSIPVISDLAFTDVTSASLRIQDQPAIVLTPATDPDGYVLTADIVLPAQGFYKWAAEVITAAAPESVVVAIGSLRVDPRVEVSP